MLIFASAYSCWLSQRLPALPVFEQRGPGAACITGGLPTVALLYVSAIQAEQCELSCVVPSYRSTVRTPTRTKMRQNKMILNHGASLATVDQKQEWVTARARELDIDTEMHIAEALSRIMSVFQQSHDFAGVSSNNIYWETTDIPVRMIYVPLNDAFVTVINPKYERLAGKSVNSTEKCGSIPGRSFSVKRKTYVIISGHDLDGEKIQLEYGSKRGAGPNCHSWIVQHEMDHLAGVLISDKAMF